MSDVNTQPLPGKTPKAEVKATSPAKPAVLQEAAKVDAQKPAESILQPETPNTLPEVGEQKKIENERTHDLEAMDILKKDLTPDEFITGVQEGTIPPEKGKEVKTPPTQESGSGYTPNFQFEGDQESIQKIREEVPKLAEEIINKIKDTEAKRENITGQPTPAEGNQNQQQPAPESNPQAENSDNSIDLEERRNAREESRSQENNTSQQNTQTPESEDQPSQGQTTERGDFNKAYQRAKDTLYANHKADIDEMLGELQTPQDKAEFRQMLQSMLTKGKEVFDSNGSEVIELYRAMTPMQQLRLYKSQEKAGQKKMAAETARVDAGAYKMLGEAYDQYRQSLPPGPNGDPQVDVDVTADNLRAFLQDKRNTIHDSLNERKQNFETAQKNLKGAKPETEEYFKFAEALEKAKAELQETEKLGKPIQRALEMLNNPDQTEFKEFAQKKDIVDVNNPDAQTKQQYIQEKADKALKTDNEYKTAQLGHNKQVDRVRKEMESKHLFFKGEVWDKLKRAPELYPDKDGKVYSAENAMVFIEKFKDLGLEAIIALFIEIFGLGDELQDNAATAA